MKACSQCKETKPLDDFHRDRCATDGRCCMCKPCRNSYKKRKYIEMDSEKKNKLLEKNRKYFNGYYQGNKEFVLEQTKKYWEKNKDRKCRNTLKWIKEHPKYNSYRSFLNRKNIERSTPSWVDKKELKRIYDERPEGFHVDHIIPLRGKTVSGLTVPWNLQYLEAKENIKKSNKLLKKYL